MAIAATPTWAANPCNLDHGFGVNFGTNVHEYKGREIRSERANSRFASYKINAPGKDTRFNWYSVEADRESGKIFSVTAYQTIAPGIPPKDWVSLAQSLMADVSEESGISADIAGTPPYSGKANGIDLSLWYWFDRGGENPSFSVSCNNETLQEELYRSIIQSEFDKADR